MDPSAAHIVYAYPPTLIVLRRCVSNMNTHTVHIREALGQGGGGLITGTFDAPVPGVRCAQHPAAVMGINTLGSGCPGASRRHVV